MEEVPYTPTGKCSDYGLVSVDPLEINILDYKNGAANWYGFGGETNLHFCIPKTAQSGDYIVVKIPKELRYTHCPDTVNPNFYIYFSGKDGPVIAYHTKADELKVVVTERAFKEGEERKDFTGWIPISGTLANTNNGLIKVNGKTAIRNKNYIADGLIPNEGELRGDKLKRVYEGNVKWISENHFSGGEEGCSHEVSGHVTAHYKSNDAGAKTRTINKYPVEEDAESRTYEIVYNSFGKPKDKGVEFYDLFNALSPLYHGNQESSFAKNIEIYIAYPSIVGYQKSTAKQIYPKKETDFPITFVGSERIVAKYNHEFRFSDKIKLRPNYQIAFKLGEKTNKSIVVRVKTKKDKDNAIRYDGFEEYYNMAAADAPLSENYAQFAGKLINVNSYDNPQHR